MVTSRCPSAIRPASSVSTLAPGPASAPPSVFTPCFAAAAKSAMVSIRSGATPRARARDVPVAVGVDEGVDAVGCGGLDPVCDAVAVRDWDHAVALQPLVVALARQADDRGPGTACELDSERADAPGGSGDDDGLALLELDGVHRPPRGHAGDVQAAGHLP